MFGHEDTDWMSPYEVPAISTTLYHDEPARPGFGQAETVSKGATVYKGATIYKGAKAATIYGPSYKKAKGATYHEMGRRERARLAKSSAFREASGIATKERLAKAARAFRGFGDATVPYTTSRGVTGTANMNTQTNCGSPFGVQQALTDLGHPVAVDGIFGQETFGALASWASENGVAYTPGTYPQGAFCSALEDAWNARGVPSSPDAPPVPVPQPAGPPSIPVTESPGILDSVKNWWTAQSSTTKLLVASSGAVAGALLVAALLKTPKAAHAR